MDRREQLNDPEEALRAAFDGQLAGLWTALPGIVDSFDPGAMTVAVQPSILGKLRAPDGAVSLVAMPLLVDVPVVFQSGGGHTMTFPVAKGDEALVVFASRCIDGWWQSGGIQAPIEMRMHDLSDGFAIVGPRSQARLIPDISVSSTQIRSDDGSTVIDLNGKARTVVVTAPGSVTVTSPQVTVAASAGVTLDTPMVHCTGGLTVDGLLTFNGGMRGASGTSGPVAVINGLLQVTGGDVTADGISLKTHTHTGVMPGGGNSGGPQ